MSENSGIPKIKERLIRIDPTYPAFEKLNLVNLQKIGKTKNWKNKIFTNNWKNKKKETARQYILKFTVFPQGEFQKIGKIKNRRCPRYRGFQKLKKD